ncbi:FAD-dependent oxidoreductase [Ignatzschineria rhizosphaerae]|uniref:FAD-dependent oxidoreductase n=1 Tax=Ignatzschineria rhizosphaerae TaxID=2923279 RepID=A0ABY3X3V4_9GAMM|nr:FAD-dependent oxidoreductase [Ignatzschineria rhizosphaerae]UNM96137.1 FAD-dependent oxidoreductase [Ignatzschineria rhizosphaerae]
MAKYITVVGGGIIGLSTALALILKGAYVTLIDAEETVGQGASFANGGQLSYRYVSPLADKGVVWQGLKWMGRVDSPLNLRIEPSLLQWQWLLRFLTACNARKNQENTHNILRLSLLSQKTLDFWRKSVLTKNFHWQQSGKMIIHRHQRDFLNAASKIDPEFQECLTAEEACRLEPSLLSIKNQLTGAIYAPGDETADAYLCCLAILSYLKAHERFSLRMNCQVDRLISEAGKIKALETSQGQIPVEHLVIAAGNGCRKLLTPLKINLPIYPLKGYSLTIPFPKESGIVPEMSVTDFAHKTVYAKLGEQLRVAAMVDIGYSNSKNRDVRPKRITALKKNMMQTFPKLKGLKDAIEWSGLRPSTPEGPPILGRTPIKNLWLNVGHGSLGFTLAAGSAEVIADLITDHRSVINLEGLTQY